MSKSAIYTANTTSTSVIVGEIVPLGNTIRRFGCNTVQDGNTITVKGRGYYKVTASFTVAPAVAGIATITMNKDGAPVIGAASSGSVSTAANPTTLVITAIVRNACDCDSSILSFVLSGTNSTLLNAAVTVEKL